MKFDFLGVPSPSATDPEGNITKTSVIIRCDEHYTILSANLDGDWTNESKEKIVDAVLEHNHKLLFVDRAMSEAVLVVEEMKSAVEHIKRTEQEIKEEAEATQTALMNVIDQLVEKGLVEL